MESRVQPELILKRKVCESCSETIFEFDSDIQARDQALERYICADCSTV